MKQTVRQSGFTLAEIAIVLAVIGIAMTMGLKLLTATLENRAISDTHAKQERIKLALVSFMRSNGRLPCPDSIALPAAPTGVEAAVCTTAALATNPAAGSGRLPWVTLGLTRDAALDGWGNFFTYRVANFVVGVDPALGVPAAGAQRHLFANHNWTINTTTDPSTFDIRSLTPANPAVAGFETFRINTRLTPAAPLTVVTQNAIAVILSHGKNGLGARTTKNVPVTPLLGAAAVDESTNGTVGTKIFVRRDPSDVAFAAATNPGGPIDDILAFLTPQDLLQPLVDDKTLVNNAVSDTQAKQERIKQALVSFMRRNNRLPCPDTTAFPTTPTGLEAAVCTTAALASNPAAGTGVVPWVPLGLTRDAVLDGWGNFFTYRVANFVVGVDPALAVPAAAAQRHLFANHNWTINDTTNPSTFDIRSLTPANPAVAGFETFRINTRLTSAAALTAVTQNAVAVILSHGKNGLGARSLKTGPVAPLLAPAVALDESANGTAGAKVFVRRDPSELPQVAATNPGGPIDDIVAFLTPQDLLQPLVDDKTLANNAVSDTQAKQDRIKQALVSFMRSNGRLPCPDTNAAPTGVEPALGCTTAAAATNPAAGSGVVPWGPLGLTRDAVLDGWGNFFTYRVANFVAVVDPVVTVASAVTPAVNVNRHPFSNHNWTIKTAGNQSTFDIRSNDIAGPTATGYQTFLINTRATPASPLTAVTRNAVAVILSHGRNGLGARSLKTGPVAPLLGVGVALDESNNGAVGAKIFVRRDPSELPQVAATNPGGPIDDIVAYLTPQDLLQPLIDDKTLLGGCKFYCATPSAGCTPLGTTPITIGSTVQFPAAPQTTCP